MLLPGWKCFDLTKCQILPSAGDKKVFKLMVSRQAEGKADKEERFITANVCSRNVWVKKLLQAKNSSFEMDDCNNVDVNDMIALQ